VTRAASKHRRPREISWVTGSALLMQLFPNYIHAVNRTLADRAPAIAWIWPEIAGY
jgi:hypothetical protein